MSECVCVLGWEANTRTRTNSHVGGAVLDPYFACEAEAYEGASASSARQSWRSERRPDALAVRAARQEVADDASNIFL